MNSIIDINQDQFIEEVIESSKKIPVLVDFWAPWCGPCKQLTPILEKIVNNKNGKIKLVKINVDENQGIASQLNIQSIPTVYGFINGRPVDAFQGAQPESKIETMINKMIDNAPGNETTKLIKEAEDFIKLQKFEEALKIYENLITLEPGSPNIIAGMIRCLIQLNRYEEAQQILNSLEDELIQNEEIKKIQKLVKHYKETKPGSVDLLLSQLKANPNNFELKFELAETYLKNNEFENGFQELLSIFKINPKWNDEAAKKKLLEYFDLLGLSDPNVVSARKKLSSLMFK